MSNYKSLKMKFRMMKRLKT